MVHFSYSHKALASTTSRGAWPPMQYTRAASRMARSSRLGRMDPPDKDQCLRRLPTRINVPRFVYPPPPKVEERGRQNPIITIILPYTGMAARGCSMERSRVNPHVKRAHVKRAHVTRRSAITFLGLGGNVKLSKLPPKPRKGGDAVGFGRVWSISRIPPTHHPEPGGSMGLEDDCEFFMCFEAFCCCLLFRFS